MNIIIAKVLKIMLRFRYSILILGLMLVLSNILAQESTIIIDSLFSKILNEQRKIKIYLPDEYKLGSIERFGVVYIIDGETHFDDFLFIYKYAKNQNFIPSLILISLPNNYSKDGNTRDRDFVPEMTTTKVQCGGADNFIAFFKNELMPYIDKELRTSGDNTLFGHSLGGLFTMYTLLKQPDLFANYYCSDPAFPWNSRIIISMAEETFQNTTKLNKNLWIIGTKETYRNVGIEKMDSVLMAYAPIGLRYKTSIYPNENHMSVRLKGIYDGLKYTYNGYNSQKMVEFHPNNGSLLEGKPAPIFLNGSFPNVYYTTDGSEPDTSSKLAPQMIEISAPAKVTVKWIGDNNKYITSSKGVFEPSKIWPPLQKIGNLKYGGLRYSYYEGEWETLPDFAKIKPIQTGIADSSFSLNKLPSETNFGCVFDGYLMIEKEGYYCFALCSSDGSKFFINDRAIINNDGIHGSEWYKSYGVPLQKGFYPVRIEYFQREGGRNFNLLYISPISYETVNMTFKMMYYK